MEKPNFLKYYDNDVFATLPLIISHTKTRIFDINVRENGTFSAIVDELDDDKDLHDLLLHISAKEAIISLQHELSIAGNFNIVQIIAYYIIKTLPKLNVTLKGEVITFIQQIIRKDDLFLTERHLLNDLLETNIYILTFIYNFPGFEKYDGTFDEYLKYIIDNIMATILSQNLFPIQSSTVTSLFNLIKNIALKYFGVQLYDYLFDNNDNNLILSNSSFVILYSLLYKHSFQNYKIIPIIFDDKYVFMVLLDKSIIILGEYAKNDDKTIKPLILEKQSHITLDLLICFCDRLNDHIINFNDVSNINNKNFFEDFISVIIYNIIYNKEEDIRNKTIKVLTLLFNKFIPSLSLKIYYKYFNDYKIHLENDSVLAFFIDYLKKLFDLFVNDIECNYNNIISFFKFLKKYIYTPIGSSDNIFTLTSIIDSHFLSLNSKINLYRYIMLITQNNKSLTSDKNITFIVSNIYNKYFEPLKEDFVNVITTKRRILDNKEDIPHNNQGCIDNFSNLRIMNNDECGQNIMYEKNNSNQLVEDLTNSILKIELLQSNMSRIDEIYDSIYKV